MGADSETSYPSDLILPFTPAVAPISFCYRSHPVKKYNLRLVHNQRQDKTQRH